MSAKQWRNLASSRSRTLAIVEVLVVWTCVILAMRAMPGSGLLTWEQRLLGCHLVSRLVLLVLVPIAVIHLTGGNPGPYGLHFAHLGYQMRIGLLSLAVVLPLSLVFPLLGRLQMSPRAWPGSLVLIAAHLIALWLVTTFLRRQPNRPPPRTTVGGLVIFLAACAGLCLASTMLWPRLRWSSGLIYAILATGVAEEVFFRGYVQSRLNRSFGSRFRTAGVTTWGWGLFITSVLFGLTYWLMPDGTVWWGLWTAASGMLFGLLREKTGGIVAPSIAHGLLECIKFVLRAGIR
jgi:uncharacterized protein